MDASQLVANLMPFLLAYLIQVLTAFSRGIAESTLRLLVDEGMVFGGKPREIAIELALHFYRQLSFVLSILLSTVSALGLTLTSKRPLIGVVVAFLMVAVIALWLFLWQSLSTHDPVIRIKRDKQMTGAGYVTITAMLVATMWSQWS